MLRDVERQTADAAERDGLRELVLSILGHRHDELV
jgi:hypothetical protein